MNLSLPTLPEGLEKLIRRYLELPDRPGTTGGTFRVQPLTPDGSDRRYFRITASADRTFIAVDAAGTGPASRFVSETGISQNHTFIRVRDHLAGLGFPVPGLLARDSGYNYYLLEDLGDVTLYRKVVKRGLDEEVLTDYRRALALLARLQVEAAAGFDPAWAYAGGFYDRKLLIDGELNYFSRAYVVEFCHGELSSLVGAGLEDEFARLADAALRAPATFFLYRDFQSRNLMIRDGDLRLIDFQGARLGPVYYDAAALINDPYTDLPLELRSELRNFYFSRLQEQLGAATPQRKEFDLYFDLFSLIRTLQTLGAFAFLSGRGKEHFRDSIPPARRNLEWTLDSLADRLPLPLLTRLSRELPLHS